MLSKVSSTTSQPMGAQFSHREKSFRLFHQTVVLVAMGSIATFAGITAYSLHSTGNKEGSYTATTIGGIAGMLACDAIFNIADILRR